MPFSPLKVTVREETIERMIFGKPIADYYDDEESQGYADEFVEWVHNGHKLSEVR